MISISDYIYHLLGKDEYCFSLEEVIAITGKTEIAIKSELARLVAKKAIINLRKGFYLIIPPRYSYFQKLPVQLYIEKLFKYLSRNYYVGLYSAAKIHGAGHQQPQAEYIMIEKPKLIDIERGNFGIQFITSSTWPKRNVEQKRSDAGNFKISSPALTIIDLVGHHSKLGGINRILPIVEELAEDMTLKDISDLLTWYPQKSNLQRMGFLLSEIQSPNYLIEPIRIHLESERFFPILLRPNSDEKAGAVDNFWKVDRNVSIQHDL